MAEEHDLAQATAKAVRAQSLIDDELLSEAFATLEASYVSAWRHTVIDDAAAREKLFLAINILAKVRDHISSVIANGKLAEAELKQLVETRERKRRFGIL